VERGGGTQGGRGEAGGRARIGANSTYHHIAIIALITLLALALRLLIVYWHNQYPLSGDEIGFFNQARTFVQGKGFYDLPFMRAPLYPIFLTTVFRFFGAEVLAARLVQALLGALTIPLLYLWTRQHHGHRAGLAAAGLGALFFGFAVQATFLLTETLFLFLFALGMALLEWQRERQTWWVALLSGILFGLCALTRSIGLPLVALAALRVWLVPRKKAPLRQRLYPALLVLIGAVLVIAPWTARNILVHNAFILIDTTGTTNLWMDNAPEIGRDAVKAELRKYPEGERQSIAVREGLRAIRAHPEWFLKKCWREIQLFFSLEYFDDFVQRPAIWYPLGEVWSRVLLGDGLYLVLVTAGLVGLFATRTRFKVLDLLWLAYIPFSTTLFHVELRYRLPFLLALIPYAAAVLAHYRGTLLRLQKRPGRSIACGFFLIAGCIVLLSHRNYLRQSGQIASKRVHVVVARWALQRGNLQTALKHTEAALTVYPESAEARVVRAQTLREAGSISEAETVLRQAIDYRSGNPRPHLLLGDLLRVQGRQEEAAAEMVYEKRSLEDLQHWAWRNFASGVPERLDLGTGLELGNVRGWYLPERTGEGIPFRWSDGKVRFRLTAPEGEGPIQLTMRLTAGRTQNLTLPLARLHWNDQAGPSFTVDNGWHAYTLEVGDLSPGTLLEFELRSDTYRPHQYDRQLDDNRSLGIMVDWIELSR
jgi:4-amino-4-deoxy-L-arabinose transferase-like glycosyltransferase